MDYVAFDVETTGTCAWRDRVVSFCLTELDADLAVLREHYELVNPGMPIPASATEVHGVTDDMVQDAPPFSRFARRLRCLLTSAPVIGYNVQFDLDIVHHELMRCGHNGLPVDLPTVDPFVVFCQDHPRTLTGALQTYCGEQHETAHDPRADVLATLKVLRAQMQGRGVQEPQRLMPERTPRGFLDRSRRFKTGENGEILLAFGKHKGEPAQLHTEYLEWMLEADFPPDTKDLVRRLLAMWIGRRRRIADAPRRPPPRAR